MNPSDSDDENIPDGLGATNIPPSIYVIKFHPNARREAVEWLLEKIEAKQKYGGAELFVRCEPQKQGKGLVVHVSATKIKLLEVAEALDLQKKKSSGLVQEFSVRDLDQFLDGGKTLETILTPSEREFCVRNELDGIFAKHEDAYIPGYPLLKLYPGQSVVEMFVREELITAIFPLHDREVLQDLGSRWYKSIFGAVTLDEIRSYFGEAIAMYFGFLGFYTLTLVAPALLGLVQMCFTVDSLSEYAFFAVFNLVWVTVFLELWKRRCSELSYNWGTLERTPEPSPRKNYKGVMKLNTITGRYEPYYAIWKTKCKLYLVSLPVVSLCTFGALWTMVLAFWAEEQLIDWKRTYGSLAGIFGHFPSAVYATAVWLLNYYYKKLATALTEWENHRNMEDHDWHRVCKLIVFEFVNNFSSLFYIAFYIQDMDMLCSQVATLLIVTQMINHFQEALLPLVVKKAYNQYSEVVVSKIKEYPMTKQLFVEDRRPIHSGYPEEEPVPVLSLDPKDPRIAQAEEEVDLDPYTDVYDDYLELFLQFGYVFLFSAVYPMAAFWAVLNNVLELKTDAFKLCRLFRRPRSKKVRGISVWQTAFELLGVVAVMTNCALLCMSPRLRGLAPNASPVKWILVFVLFEHAIFALKMALARCFSDKPKWVRDALEQVAYQAKTALRNERGKKTRRHLSRRFRSVHGMPRSGSRSRATTPVAQNGSVRHRGIPAEDFSPYTRD